MELILYRLSVIHFPEHSVAPNALFGAAYCFAKQEAYEEAVRDWSAIVRKYPTSGLVEESLYQKAMGEIRLKRDVDSIQSLRDLVKKFPNSKYVADAHYWQAMLLKESEKYHDAEAEFRIALKLKMKPDLARDAEMHLAVVLQRTGKLEEAANIYQSLLATPVSQKFAPELLQWLAEYRIENKKPADSIPPLRLLIRQHTGLFWQQAGYTILGRAYTASGKKPDAEAAYLKAVGVEKKTRYLGESALSLGDMNSEVEKWADAERFYGLAAEAASGQDLPEIRARAYAGIARVAEKSGDNEKAAKYFMSVAILYDDETLVSECLYGAYKAFNTAENHEAAQRALKELLERYPSSAWAVKGKGKLNQPSTPEEGEITEL